MMSVVLKVWLPAPAVLALVALTYLIVNWTLLSTTHRLSFILAILLVLHMAEEGHFPGRFPYMFNVLVRGATCRIATR
jgi:hypothetical protein